MQEKLPFSDLFDSILIIGVISVVIVVVMIVVLLYFLRNDERQEALRRYPPQVQTKYCKHCGHQMPVDASVCPHCGERN